MARRENFFAPSEPGLEVFLALNKLKKKKKISHEVRLFHKGKTSTDFQEEQVFFCGRSMVDNSAFPCKPLGQSQKKKGGKENECRHQKLIQNEALLQQLLPNIRCFYLIDTNALPRNKKSRCDT